MIKIKISMKNINENLALSKYYASANLSVICSIGLLLDYGFVKVGSDEALIDIIRIQL